MPPPGVILDIIEQRNRREGVGSLENPLKFRGQDFHSLRQYCLSHRLRFVDDTFPPDSSSIGPGLLEDRDLANVVWRRPREIVKNPQLIVDGVSRFDFGQGRLGDCWFLASIGAMTFQEKVLKQVLPIDQGFGDLYAGIFHFRFWRFGKWVDVVVDDKLPTINNMFIFVHPKTTSEFWAALLEKAYAKVCGSYSDLAMGYLSEAMLDFTGGVYVGFNLRNASPDLWDVISRAVKHVSLLGCLTPQGEKSGNSELPNGLVTGHAYAVTGVTQVMSYGCPVRLVRVWNPWGQAEWTGDWSDRSSLWRSVSVEDRTNCLQIADNGEFWISFEHFLQNFCMLEICCLSPNFLDGSSCRWASSYHEGRWVAGVTAGGCTNYMDTFWTNPQYLLTITATGPEYSEHQGSRNTLVTLIQKSDKSHRHLAPNYGIGFYVYLVPPEFQTQRQKFPSSFFDGHNLFAKTESFPDAREMTAFFQLMPGRYVIVPSTKHPNEACSFVMKIFSKFNILAEECSTQHHLEASKINPSDRYKVDDFQHVFRQYHDQYMEVDAEQLQMLLNEKTIRGFRSETGGFALDTCRSIIAMMDLSVTGKLNSKEFSRLWKRVLFYREIFLKFDISRSGRLPLSKLRDAIQATGSIVSEGLLNLTALRYSSSSGEISLESFIYLLLRLDYMDKTFRNMTKGDGIHLEEKEWLYLTIYS